jgi:3-deoxy-D-manno-octulosonate 8-phosphate phosphatase (KDO 8-P phosphatase)
VRDGAALRMWARLGYETAVITGRNGMALRHRLRELGVRHVVSGSKEKGAAFEALLGEVGIAAGAVAMIGDDLPDLPILRRCGLPIAVRDAAQEVLDIAKFVTARPGGSGAVREAVEHILKGQGRWFHRTPFAPIRMPCTSAAKPRTESMVTLLRRTSQL